MAKEEQQTIGISRGLSITIMLVVGVIAAMAFWFDRGGTEAKAEAIHNSIVSALIETDSRHAQGISRNATDIKAITDNQHKAEVARVKLEGKVDTVISIQTAMKASQDKFIDYLMQYDYDKKKETD